MSRSLISILMAGVLVLAASLLMMYAAAFALPSLSEEYYSTVFRSSQFNTQWLFYIHPFVLSAALLWFWHHLKDQLSEGRLARAVEFGARYGVVAMLPVLLLTFSAINVSFLMVITWLLYGIVQAITAGLVFAGRHG